MNLQKYLMKQSFAIRYKKTEYGRGKNTNIHKKQSHPS